MGSIIPRLKPPTQGKGRSEALSINVIEGKKKRGPQLVRLLHSKLLIITRKRIRFSRREKKRRGKASGYQN